MDERERRFWEIESLLKEEYNEAGKAEYSTDTVRRLVLSLEIKERLDKLKGIEV
jgi:hypothetical protein